MRAILYARTMNAGAGLPDEELIWEGHPTWKAWAGKWIAGWALLPLVVGLFLLATVWMRTRSQRWKLTSKRIEIERGLFGKRVDTLELWRVRDVELRQSALDRFLGVSSILVTAHDGSYPALEIRGVPGDRTIYDRLMTAVMQARQQRGVMNLNP
jgi:membrane protein YdbS with pleckstrin-like domain